MIPRNQFVNSEPVADQPRDDGDHEDYDLENWNDTPPHENGEGWDGNGFGAGVIVSAARRETEAETVFEASQTYDYVSP